MELKVALPGDQSHSWYQNTYDARAYKRLCNEFGVSPNTDWRQKLDHGCQGLGSWSTYMEPSGAYRHAHYSDGPFFHPMDAIRHNRDISGAWTMFIPDKSEGFTQAGVERLNDSIRMYVWAIQGAQAQTRSNILKAGTGFDAQKQFLANVEDAIASPVEPSGAYRHAHYSDGPFFHPMDAIRHNRDISWAWTMFIPDKSEGFTQAGVERLNDSIRMYVWAIQGAQAQTRSNILKAGTGFDAQKQFLANVEDAIASPVDIPSSIARYQKTLQYASTPLDYVFGLGLYLAPSDMTLHPGNVHGYNNEIMIAGSEAAIGHNPGINGADRQDHRR